MSTSYKVIHVTKRKVKEQDLTLLFFLADSLFHSVPSTFNKSKESYVQEQLIYSIICLIFIHFSTRHDYLKT